MNIIIMLTKRQKGCNVREVRKRKIKKNQKIKCNKKCVNNYTLPRGIQHVYAQFGIESVSRSR